MRVRGGGREAKAGISSRFDAPLPTPTGRQMPPMATRQERLDAFTGEGEPSPGQAVELLCEDHVGTYVIPFLCRRVDGDWTNAGTGERIAATVIGWRKPQSAA